MICAFVLNGADMTGQLGPRALANQKGRRGLEENAHGKSGLRF
jgi:hypothetical protein